jgi:hypothetical protein
MRAGGCVRYKSQPHFHVELRIFLKREDIVFISPARRDGSSKPNHKVHPKALSTSNHLNPPHPHQQPTMPLWRIFSHPSTFTSPQRHALAGAITHLYTSNVGFPAFYVNVLFIDLDDNSCFIGGEENKDFVRIVVEQIARPMATPETEEGRARRKRWMDMINEVGPLVPLLDGGLDGLERGVLGAEDL